jgi:hypothetical protein
MIDCRSWSAEQRQANFWAMPINELRDILRQLTFDNKLEERGARIDALSILTLRT